MSATRFRRIARLERLAELYLEWKSGIEKEWQAFWVEALRTQPFLPF